MALSFSRLCHDAPLQSQLRQQIDRCAARGESFSLAPCRMPEGCSPTQAALLFFRRGDGGYVMYRRPNVAYSGKSAALRALFRQNLRSFASYDLLAAYLRSLCAELPNLDAEPPGDACPPRSTVQPHEPPHACPAAYFPLRRALGEKICGQPSAVDAAARYLSGHIAKCAPSRPLSLLLYGPTGVGKSELGKAIAPAMRSLGYGEWQFVWTELNTFTHSHSVHRLIGAPPGYVGYEDAPVFAAVQQNPRTVFMFDELDKAHPDVWKVFMSILDEGRCTLNRAAPNGTRELDFRRCVLLFTSNLGLAAPDRRIGFSPTPDEPPPPPNSTAATTPEESAQRLFLQNEFGRSALLRHGVLREIAGRFTGFIGFQPLSAEAQRQVLALKAISLGAEYGLSVTEVTPEAAAALLPPGELFSIRSAICLLDAKLSPLFQAAAGASDGKTYRLVCRSGSLALAANGFAAAVSQSSGAIPARFDLPH